MLYLTLDGGKSFWYYICDKHILRPWGLEQIISTLEGSELLKNGIKANP